MLSRRKPHLVFELVQWKVAGLDVQISIATKTQHILNMEDISIKNAKSTIITASWENWKLTWLKGIHFYFCIVLSLPHIDCSRPRWWHWAPDTRAASWWGRIPSTGYSHPPLPAWCGWTTNRVMVWIYAGVDKSWVNFRKDYNYNNSSVFACVVPIFATSRPVNIIIAHVCTWDWGPGSVWPPVAWGAG